MENKVKVCVENLNVHYGEKQALFDVCMDINQNEITALIGPLSNTHLTLPTICSV